VKRRSSRVPPFFRFDRQPFSMRQMRAAAGDPTDAHGMRRKIRRELARNH